MMFNRLLENSSHPLEVIGVGAVVAEVTIISNHSSTSLVSMRAHCEPYLKMFMKPTSTTAAMINIP